MCPIQFFHEPPAITCHQCSNQYKRSCVALVAEQTEKTTRDNTKKGMKSECSGTEHWTYPHLPYTVQRYNSLSISKQWETTLASFTAGVPKSLAFNDKTKNAWFNSTSGFRSFTYYIWQSELLQIDTWHIHSTLTSKNKDCVMSALNKSVWYRWKILRYTDLVTKNVWVELINSRLHHVDPITASFPHSFVNIFKTATTVFTVPSL